MIERLSDNNGVRYRLTPNRSISWPGLVRVWLALTLLMLVVVAGLSMAGAWLVVPFAGLELVALALGFWYTARRCRRQQVLTFGRETIRLESGHQQKEVEQQWPRPTVSVELDPRAHPWAPERLHLCSRGEDVLLADFLNPGDSRELVTLIASQGIPVRRRTAAGPAVWF